MTLTPYLMFDGRCREALEFYRDVLGGSILLAVPYGQSPAAGGAPADYILHATFALPGQQFHAADAPPGQYREPQGFSVMLGIDDPEEAERVYQALSAGGSVQMAAQETFWALIFAMFTDRFGTPWLINCGRPGIQA